MPTSSALSPWIKNAGRQLLDILLPGRCIQCGIMVQETGTLCSSCWGKVAFLKEPCCFACGYPFEFDMGKESLCPACTLQRPLYHRARAFMVYNQDSSRPILSFKHGDRTDLAKTFAAWLMQSGRELIKDAELFIPVPLHWTRLFHRRYNQAALLTNELARRTGKTALNQALIRVRATASQGHRTRAEREKNIHNAFKISPKYAPQIADRRLLLIDDVMTTGATISACAKVLLAGGAAQIDVLTIARIVLPSQIS